VTRERRCSCEPYELCECFEAFDYNRPPEGYYVGQTYISAAEIDGGEQTGIYLDAYGRQHERPQNAGW